MRDIGRKTPLPSLSDARAEGTQRSSQLPDMEHMARALKALSSRQALLQAAIQRKDEGHFLEIEVLEAAQSAQIYLIIIIIHVFSFLCLLFEMRDASLQPYSNPKCRASRLTCRRCRRR
jgi:hypothetical protein